MEVARRGVGHHSGCRLSVLASLRKDPKSFGGPKRFYAVAGISAPRGAPASALLNDSRASRSSS